MKILFCGAFNIGSSGDEAALTFLTRELAKDGHEFTVMTRDPTKGYRHPTIPKLEWHCREYGHNNFRGFNPGDDPRRIEEILDALSDCDLLLLGPGAFFNEHNTDMWRGALQEMYAMSMLAEWAGCPYGIWGASASNITRPIQTMQACRLIENAEFVILRDRLSKLKLPHLSGVIELPDPVWGFTEPMRTVEDGERLCISTRELDYQGASGMHRACLQEIVNWWNGPITWVEQYGGDRPDREEFAYNWNDRSSMVRSENPADLIDAYHGALFVVSLRLHGVIFAILAGVQNIIPISYDPKTEGLLEWFSREPAHVGDNYIEYAYHGGWDLEPILEQLPKYLEIINRVFE